MVENSISCSMRIRFLVRSTGVRVYPSSAVLLYLQSNNMKEEKQDVPKIVHPCEGKYHENSRKRWHYVLWYK